MRGAARQGRGWAAKKLQMTEVASSAWLGGSRMTDRRWPPGHEWPPSAIVMSSTAVGARQVAHRSVVTSRAVVVVDVPQPSVVAQASTPLRTGG